VFRRPCRSPLVCLALALVLAASGLLAACGGPSPEGAPSGGDPSASPYKIGFLVAATGSSSLLGEPERDAAAMLQEQLDAQGGIAGPDGTRHPVEILIYDTQGSGDTAITLAKKLINDEGVVAIVGTTISPEAMALLPVIEEAETPLISMASSGAIVSPVAERHWVFKSAQSNEHTAPSQVRYAAALGVERIANVYVNNAYGEDGAIAIRDAAAEAGIEIVLEETFDAADTDMTAQLTKLRASGAEALLVTAIPPAAAILTKQFREMGISMPIIHNHGIGMKSFIDLCGASVAEGVVFPMGKVIAADLLADDDPQKPVLTQFVADYTAAGGAQGLHFAGHAWDGIMMVARALETMPAGLSLAEQRAHVRDALEATSGFAGIGGMFNLSAEDHVGLSPDDIVMVRVTNGEWEYFAPERW
jgi:branched-chain amino acid transport system substrate-binding protein